ncbi:hypothetical protein CTRC69_03295 [Chlamydia trachomatis RC-F/69]|nr:hypothetical protein E150_03285 [Chlamydia trachomatis E/150]ADH21101.1 hypothetical protein E11023_03265 [Chlamydia trachomatis E/11023]AGR94056.1 hypothetical protein CTRC69_03295 [Chlamydia trachomatis RC-F/69]AGR95902.1 hypothetical protein CTRC852_03330 [Chlamydia trachomatis RC-F(s)/852]AGR99621.1 hypothetical protein CTRC342_03320 [Chlamydia trachomatis RC-F(s)/342]
MNEGEPKKNFFFGSFFFSKESRVYRSLFNNKFLVPKEENMLFYSSGRKL